MSEERRQPIISVLGHVDSGKTTLLDKIRTSTVVSGEAGGITQQIGATQVPVGVIEDLCSKTLSGSKIDVPGLLFIDTPGHEAFTTLRRRGGSISDLAILIVDVNEGFEPQTEESLTFLKDFNTPFVVAATKIDTISGWNSNEGECFLSSYKNQRKEVRERLDNKIYEIMGDLSERDFTSDRYDRVDDFQNKIGIVPVSGVTGEGIPDLLSILVGLSQRFLSSEIEMEDEVGKGNVLEVKESKGLGTTIDVILYEGSISKGEKIVIGGEKPIVTKVRALLEPRQMKELRTEKRFQRVDSVKAAVGVKISAPDLDDAIAGSPLRVVKSDEEIDKVKDDLQREVKDIEIETEGEGIILKADTLGSLEGLIKILKDKEIPIRKAKIGDVTRRDVMQEKSVDDPLKRAVFAFNVDVTDQANECKEDVKIFHDPVIYQILEEYERWKKERREEMKREKLEQVTRPGKVQLLPGYVFRQRKPAIIGSEVVNGTIKPGYSLVKEGNIVGKIKEIQKEGVNVDKAETGDKVAVSISNVTVGRQVEEGDVLYNALSDRDIRRLEDLQEYLSRGEKRVLKEVKEKLYG